MTKILVVDDEPDLETLISQKFRKKIKEGEFTFLFAINGKDALEKVKNEGDIDLVLSDINMPEMDGLTLLSKLNENDYFLKTVIVSAYGDMDNIRTAMNLGAFDFVTKPIDFKDLEITMSKSIRHILDMKKSVETLRENDTLKIYLKEINAQKKLKDKFFAIISHDLRGPVNAFHGLTDIMKMYVKKGQFEELESMLDLIDSSTSQLSRLLDNLLNWASQELSEIPYNPEKISLKEMVVELLEIFQSAATAKSIDLVDETTENAIVWADKNTIMTILRNLINNALKFTNDNGSITIKSAIQDQKVAISIIDSGLGMSEDTLESLFSLTEGSSSYGTHGEKGVGLGLKLVKEFVTLNKGSITVKSEEGKGSEFTVLLPTAS